MAKPALLFILLSIQVTFQACTQIPLDEMTQEDWQDDLDYLDKKIQKEFQSFNPKLKPAFSDEMATLKSKLNDLENYEIACEIMRLLATLQDGHTELNIGQERTGFHRVPLSLYFFQNELYVIAAHEEFRNLVGGKVIGIGDYSMNEAFSKLKKTMSRDNDMEYLHAGPGYLILTELLKCLSISENENEVSFEIELKSGEVWRQSLEGMDVNTYSQGPWITLREVNDVDQPLYLSNQGSRYWHQYLFETKTMYFNFTRVNNQKGQPSIKKYIKILFEEIDEEKPEKLIIDFRLNNGGNYNLSRPLIEAIKSRPWLNQEGKIWVITGRRTFSAASVASIFLKTETEAILIGEPGRTHPNLADNNEYMNLPKSGFLIEYTTKVKEHWPEKPGLDRIPVDISVIPQYESYSKGEDSVLLYILRADVSSERNMK